jgi:hypothetical protein
VFVGGFTLALAQHVSGDDELDEWAVLDALAGLVDKSWMQVSSGDVPRYHLLESARLFALAQLRLAGEESGARERHCAAMAALAARHFTNHWHLSYDASGLPFVAECDNLAAAFDFAMNASSIDAAARVFVAMQTVFKAAGRDPELRAFASVLEPRIGSLREKLQAQVLAAIGFSAVDLTLGGVEYIRRALPLLEDQGGDDDLMVRVLSNLAVAMSDTGALNESREMLTRMRAMQSPRWSPFLTAFATFTEARVSAASGDVEGALRSYGLAISQGETAGARRVVQVSQIGITLVLSTASRFEESISTAIRLLPSLVGPAWWHARGYALNNLAMDYVKVGRLGRARDAALEGLLMLRRFGDTTALLDTVIQLALRCARPETAAQLSGHLEATHKTNQLPLTPVALECQRVVLEKLSHAFTTAELERWRARGATLSDEQVDALVRDLPDH